MKRASEDRDVLCENSKSLGFRSLEKKSGFETLEYLRFQIEKTEAFAHSHLFDDESTATDQISFYRCLAKLSIGVQNCMKTLS